MDYQIGSVKRGKPDSEVSVIKKYLDVLNDHRFAVSLGNIDGLVNDRALLCQ